jgi:hypothetical protein
MPVIRAAATAEHCQSRQQPRQFEVLITLLIGVTCIQPGTVIELGMAATRSVGTQATNALAPVATVVEDMAEVRRMRAVDHVVGGIAVGLEEIASCEGVDDSYVSRMVNLTTLAPEIVAAILDETLP